MAAKRKPAKKKAPAKVPDNVTPIADAPKRNPAEHLKSYRWEPGQSGNPAGRTRQKTLEESLRTYLQDVLEVDVNTGDEVTRLDAMVRVIFSEGITHRNAKVLVAIMDRLWPKPLVIKGDPDAPITIQPPSLDHLSTKELKQISALRRKIAAGASDQ